MMDSSGLPEPSLPTSGLDDSTFKAMSQLHPELSHLDHDHLAFDPQPTKELANEPSDEQPATSPTPTDQDNKSQPTVIKFNSLQAHPTVIPSYAAWFDFKQIHDLELQAMPEFFTSKNKQKTPSMYKTYRDFMIHSYRMNPADYLTVTACRRNLMGDVCAIMRVHAFLEQWGLINYQVDATTMTKLTPHALETQQLDPFSVQQHLPSPPPSSSPLPAMEKQNVDSATIHTFSSSSTKPASPTTPEQDKPDAMEVDGDGERTCDTDATHQGHVWYTAAATTLCEECYVNCNYSFDLQPEQFTKHVTPLKDDPWMLPWTVEELELLNEAMAKFDGDWNKVSDHVQTRTRDQCVLQYLGLVPQEPSYDIPVADLGLLQYDRVAKHPSKHHPILSTVAFLASIVQPPVAAAPLFEERPTVAPPTNEHAAKEKEELERRNVLYQWIRARLEQAQAQTSHYADKESLLEEERQRLEKERYSLGREQTSLQDSLTSLRQAFLKKYGYATLQQQQMIQRQQQQQQLQQQQQHLLQQQQQQQHHQQEQQQQLQQQQQQQQHHHPQHQHHLQQKQTLGAMTPAQLQEQMAAAAAAAHHPPHHHLSHPSQSSPGMPSPNHPQPPGSLGFVPGNHPMASAAQSNMSPMYLQQQPHPQQTTPHAFIQQRLQQQQMQAQMQMQQSSQRDGHHPQNMMPF
ncbi:SWIRM-domain-containing protein [Hesseltinella vesiculosa]|uniref:SWIRM-domain-containing protein n=1 Tax=Hesseltinella vesiculosa TaxID=101127 RepID=A0A1X2G882_9FUNG|nr:SWIRM-domain-containing protein [Hesseltinella vesiculosa]